MDHVNADTVIFGGADVVDGTPVLDIKPYIPYVDGGVGAQAPAWVSLIVDFNPDSCPLLFHAAAHWA